VLGGSSLEYNTEAGPTKYVVNRLLCGLYSVWDGTGLNRG
jgi:hypothetical protein